MIGHNVRYVSFAASAAALLWLAHAGIVPTPNPVQPGQYLLDTGAHSPRTLRTFFRRPDVIIGLTFVFATAGPTITLPSDFNINSNTVACIGSGFAGQGGQASTGGGIGGGGTTGAGGVGGGGGAFASIVNYSAHGAGAVVSIQIGTGDTWFDTSSTVLAKASTGQVGGLASSSIGTVTFSGGNGGNGGSTGDPGGMGGGGGGGGGAGGPSGAGNNGADGIIATSGGQQSGGQGASGDNGNTPAAGTNGGSNGVNGTQFDATHGVGSGGTGSNGGGFLRGTNDAQTPGGTGGAYGGGGGGGGGGGTSSVNGSGNGGNGGNAFQGLIAISYTPASGGGAARSFGIIVM